MQHAWQSSEISIQDYLDGEQVSSLKHEYIAGQVFAMAGANEAHVTIAGNLFSLLRGHVRGGPCRVYISDMKVRVDAANSFLYPDVFVTCHPDDASRPLMKHYPTLIVEVLSDSTAAFDRGAKFAHYRHIPSLAEYVLIEPEAMSIDVFRRNAEGHWVLHPFGEGETLDLMSLDFHCAMDSVYEDVTFPAKIPPKG